MSVLRKILYGFSVLLSTLLLLACLVPYFEFASLSFLSLTVPLLVLVNLALLFFWLILNKRNAWLPILALVVGYFSLGSFVQFRSLSRNESDLKADFSIMTFNSRGFNGYGGLRRPESKQGIIDFITKESPDIICFQEFDAYRRKSEELNDYSSKYVYGPTKKNMDKVLQAIYSKYPIVDKGVVVFPNSSNQAIYADIKINNDTIRAYNVHLESLKIRPKMFGVESSERLFKRLKTSFSKQYQQAIIVSEHASSSPYPVLICGDFNNTQFSSVYRSIKGDRVDTFMEKGFGYGKTIKFWHFPLRIDFILADSFFEIKTHKNFDVWLSDHKPIMATLKIESDK